VPLAGELSFPVFVSMEIENGLGIKFYRVWIDEDNSVFEFVVKKQNRGLWE